MASPLKSPRSSGGSDQSTKSFPYHERVYLDPLEQQIPFFYTTHSFIALCSIVVPLIYVAIINPPSSENTMRACVYFCLYVYYLIAAMVFPAGPFIRPHPVVWRLVFATSLLYTFVLVVLIIVPPNDARWLLAQVDSSLGTPITLQIYAQNCSLSYQNVMDKMDRFVIAHFIGWFVKGLLIRHRLMLWCMSVVWELVELSTYYYIPNFAECWWDQWVLDFLICNGIGLECGLLVCSYLEHSKYEWCELFDEKTVASKSCHFFKLFSPASWVHVKWEAGSSTKRFVQLLLLMLLVQINEMDAFLLKLYLWIPSQHWWNGARLFLMAFITIPAIRQFYFYVTDTNITRMGSQLFVLILIIVLESILAYKTSPDDIPHAPLINRICWAIFAVFFMLFIFLIVRRFDHEEEGNNNASEKKTN